MRTTVTFDPDTAAAVERVRRERGVGMSAAVNHLVREGLVRGPERRPFEQETSAMVARIDVANVAEALELLDGPASG